jgi:FMN reductase
MVLDHALRPLFSHLRAVVVPTGVFAASEDFGRTDEGHLDKRVRRAASELAALMGVEAPAAESFTDERRSVEEQLEDPTPFDELLRRASRDA